MPNKKISQLTAGDPAQNADQIPINRSGANFSVTAESVSALAFAQIADLTDGSPAQSGDKIPIIRSGSTLRVPASSVAALSVSGAAAGTNLLAIQNPALSASGFSGAASSCIIVRIPAGCLLAIGSKIQVSIQFDPTSTGNVPLVASVVRRTLAGDVTFTDTTPLTWSGTATPTFNTTATKKFTSDSVAVTLDSLHDIYIILRPDTTVSGSALFNNFEEKVVTKCSGEVTNGTLYDNVAAIPDLTTLLGALSTQAAMISRIVLGA